MRFKEFFRKVLIAICIVTMGLSVVAFGVNSSSEAGVNHISPNQGNNVVLKEKIFGITVITGNNIRVDEEIDGTALVFGNGIDINSNVNGDLICFGNNVKLNGKIDGNSYVFAYTVELNGNITRDLFGFASNISISDGGSVHRDVVSFASNNDMLGNVGRSYTAYGSSSNIDGTINGNAHIEGNMMVGDNAVIDGSLTQVNNQEDKVSDGARVSGEVKYLYKDYDTEIPLSNRILSTVRSFIFSIVLGIIIWLIVVFFAPSFVEKGVALLEKPVQTIGLGAIIFMVVPIVSIIILFTVVGIPVSIIALILYGILIYLSQYLSSIVIGNFIVRRFNLKSFHNNFWYVLGTFVILILLSKVPYLGVIVSIACICISFGVMFYRSYKKDAYIG